jgi:mRNA interferase MazF
VRRGEIRWFTFEPPNKRRPVLILTRDSALGFLKNVVVAPITTNIRNIPSEVYLDEQDGMLEPCVINFDNLLTVPTNRLDAVITELTLARLLEVENAIGFALGFMVNSNS